MNAKWMSQTKYLLVLAAAGLTLGTVPARSQDAPPQDAPAYDQNNYPQDNENYNAPMPQNNGANGDYDVPDNGQDPPTRVARLSYVDGTVSFQPGGQGDWGAAARNRPVTVGDKIWADNNSRAELQAGEASIHISSVTALSFLNLDEQTTQMRVAEGAVNFRIRELREGDVYEVDTPNVVFNVSQAGAFRIEVNENGDATRITTIRGEGQVTANGEVYTIHAGERGEFNGADGQVTYFVAAAPAPDDFDQWSNGRDLRDDNSASARYVSRDVPGYSDLDDNGSWNEEPDYGPVWYPNQVDVGWAPYSNGYWNYVGPWGWTWIGYEPWGFAPYHYGRWAFIGSRWGWCPGPYYARPVYGPAFVGFLGGGFGFGFGFGGGIGWFPLGFREPFHPWYHTSAGYFRSVNFSNTRFRDSRFLNDRGRNFNYAYAHNTRAVTISSRNNFVNGQAINRGAFHANEAALRGAQISNRAGLSPTRQSYFGAAGARGNIARPSASIQNRSVMARTTPAAGLARSNVRTFGGNQGGRGGFGNGATIGRSAESNAATNRNRPPSAQNGQTLNDRPHSNMRNSPVDSGAYNRGQANSGNSRNWAAQGNTTDRGRAPAGFGSNPSSRSDRPAWAGSGNGNSGYSVSPRSNASSRPGYSNGSGNSRAYNPPQRNYPGASNPGRSYSAPRSFSGPSRPYSPPSRSYSAPSRSYSAPSRSYSAPSHSSGGGGSSHSSGGGSHGGGGGGSHGGGGSSHSGGSHGRT